MSRLKTNSRPHRFWRNDRGQSAVEAALILPILVMIFFGCALYGVSYLDSKASDRATSIIADLMSRQTTVDATFLNKMKSVYKNLIRNADRFAAFRVSSIKKADDKLSVDWSYADGISALANKDIASLSLPNFANNDSVIFVESSIRSTFLVNPWNVTLDNVKTGIAARPRFTSAIVKTD